MDPIAHPPADEPAPGWGQSLSAGSPGIALLHVERARSGMAGWDAVHAWITAVTRSPVYADPECSLFQGAPALAFALHVADQPGYAPALRTLDSCIMSLTRRRITNAYARMDRQELPALSEYDLIKGLTGLGVYLLNRDPGGPTLHAVLDYLVRLTHPLRLNGELLPGWWTGHATNDKPSPSLPGGHGNLGIAHGISGPLALLAIAMKRDVIVNGHAEAIATICTWLDTWCQDDVPGPWWPGWVTREELRDQRLRQTGPMRPSWCYGTPGLARAQQLAGQAIGDTGRQAVAEHALLGCVSDPSQLDQLSDVSLCHGWAGLLHVVWRSAKDSSDGALASRMPGLLARWEQHTNVEPATGLGLLEGAAGVRLAQHAVTHDPPTLRWDACLLLDG